MLGFHSISEAPISSLLVILILNGDIYLAALNINKEIDLNNYINISADIDVNLNITTEFIVSR